MANGIVLTEAEREALEYASFSAQFDALGTENDPEARDKLQGFAITLESLLARAGATEVKA